MSAIAAYWKAVGKLRPEQVRRLNTVEWLLDSSSTGSVRGSGRTTLMALAFLRDACAHPGRSVPLFDHVAKDRVIHDSLGVILSDVHGAANDVEFSPMNRHASIRVRDSLTYVLMDPVQGPTHVSGHESGSHPVLEGEIGVDDVLQDILEAARSALKLGVPADVLISEVRDVVVRTVMEE